MWTRAEPGAPAAGLLRQPGGRPSPGASFQPQTATSQIHLALKVVGEVGGSVIVHGQGGVLLEGLLERGGQAWRSFREERRICVPFGRTSRVLFRCPSRGLRGAATGGRAGPGAALGSSCPPPPFRVKPASPSSALWASSRPLSALWVLTGRCPRPGPDAASPRFRESTAHGPSSASGSPGVLVWI